MDGDAVFEAFALDRLALDDDLLAFEPVGDVLAGIDEGLGDDAGGLGLAPAFERGAKFDALAIQLVAHVAPGDDLGSIGGVAFVSEDVFKLRPLIGRWGRRGDDGDELGGVGIEDALLLQLLGDAELAPVVVRPHDEPPDGIAVEGTLLVLGDGEHRLGRARFGNEGKGVHGELSFGGRQIGGKRAFLRTGDGVRGVEPPREASEGGRPLQWVGVSESLAERGPNGGFLAGAADAPGFEVGAVLAVVVAGEFDEDVEGVCCRNIAEGDGHFATD